MHTIDTGKSDSQADRPGPYAALAAKARRTSDGALVGAAAAGLGYLGALVALHPAWWQFVVAPVAVGAFGAWGIADRELTSAAPGWRRHALRMARVLAAVIGTVAVALSAFRIVGAVVGTVIS